MSDNHETFQLLWVDEKVYRETAQMECNCRDTFERCLRCRTLDCLRKVDGSNRRMDKLVGYIVGERDTLHWMIKASGDQELIAEAQAKKEELAESWEEYKQKRGWK